jgi:DNA-binding IscR family transcriptional regulator
LFGAELSFAFQNEKKYRFSFESNELSDFEIVQVCIIIMYYISKKFYNDNETSEIINVDYLSEKFNVSENIINYALSYLTKSKLVVIDNTENEEILPYIDPAKITVKHIFDSVVDSGKINVIQEFKKYIDNNLINKLKLFNKKDFVMDLNFKQIVEKDN